MIFLLRIKGHYNIPTLKGLHHRKIYRKIVCSRKKTSICCRGEWHAIESVNSHQKSVSSYKRSRSVSPIYREPRGLDLRSKKATQVVPQQVTKERRIFPMIIPQKSWNESQVTKRSSKNSEKQPKPGSRVRAVFERLSAIPLYSR